MRTLSWEDMAQKLLAFHLRPRWKHVSVHRYELEAEGQLVEVPDYPGKEGLGDLFRTIWKGVTKPPDVIGGRRSPAVPREYACEDVTDLQGAMVTFSGRAPLLRDAIKKYSPRLAVNSICIGFWEAQRIKPSIPRTNPVVDVAPTSLRLFGT